jgi:hypothetical protein
MVISPRSRGKGNRRAPHPRRSPKQRPADWRSRAQHLVASPEELAQPVVAIPYGGVYGKGAAQSMYSLDQQMARLRLKFFAKYHGGGYLSTRFAIVVSDEHADLAAKAIDRIPEMTAS